MENGIGLDKFGVENSVEDKLKLSESVKILSSMLDRINKAWDGVGASSRPDEDRIQLTSILEKLKSIQDVNLKESIDSSVENLSNLLDSINKAWNGEGSNVRPDFTRNQLTKILENLTNTEKSLG